MDTEQHDQDFARTFMVVLGVLVGITLTIALIANLYASNDTVDPAITAQVESRLQPEGKVVTDPAMLVQVAMNKPESAPRSAEQVVQTVCAACHVSGVLNAPKIGDTAIWKQKLDSMGLEAIIASAIAGKGAMPARGGDASLSDEQVADSVKLMIKDSGL